MKALIIPLEDHRRICSSIEDKIETIVAEMRAILPGAAEHILRRLARAAIDSVQHELQAWFDKWGQP